MDYEVARLAYTIKEVLKDSDKYQMYEDKKDQITKIKRINKY